MDYGQTVHILGIGLRGEDIVIIRDEFGMDTGFFGYGDDVFQKLIVLQTECDHDLIIVIFGQYFFQVIDPGDHMDIAVSMSQWFVIVKDAVDGKSPFGMCQQTVDIALCGTAVPHEQDVFLVQSLAAELAHDGSSGETEQYLQEKVQGDKYNDEQSCIILIAVEKKENDTVDDTDYICLEHIDYFGFAAFDALGII